MKKVLNNKIQQIRAAIMDDTFLKNNRYKLMAKSKKLEML